MILNACLIVKDDSELDSLSEAIKALYAHVDGIYITITGENHAKLDQSLNDIPKIHVSYFPWCEDFAKARNFNFSQVPENTDWIYWQDADDITVHADRLKEVAQTASDTDHDVVFFTYWYACTFKDNKKDVNSIVSVDVKQMRERLLRPNVCVWKGRLHETPVPVSGQRDRYTKYEYNPEKGQEIVVVHMMDESNLPEKTARNKRILLVQLDEEQATGKPDPRTLLSLMKIYAESDDSTDEELKLVTEYGREYLTLSGWDEERATANEQMAIAEGRLGHMEMTRDYLLEAIKEWPHNPLIYLRLASAFYNLKQYSKCRHFLTVAQSMDFEKNTAGARNMKGARIMEAELEMKLAFNVDRDSKKASEAALILASEHSTQENIDQAEMIEAKYLMNEACRNIDELCTYLHSIGAEENIIKVINSLPEVIQDLEFAQKIRRAVTPPRVWEKDEICYFANFGTPSFEKWDGNSRIKGIGGSETAVIELAKEWVKKGYKVTVYGDPKKACVVDGVNYLPWHFFNHKDYFNIFIQWRSWSLSDKIKARRFYCDLHDLINGVDLLPSKVKGVDAFMLKSKFHRGLMPLVSDEKINIISNGI